ncbi:PR domain zinc finger protein 5-like isoform X1 [Pectinophora gossypiella]|uniref:PR domain zinc finger protein 5-like isoform X1 n=1 Tax=Pectinophora gossypiella TaxID=13191 RepID=UPI00214E279F|nr:PR domain zinc finger protein 5-like isoform X1 [Pectinophora gossypiella]
MSVKLCCMVTTEGTRSTEETENAMHNAALKKRSAMVAVRGRFGEESAPTVTNELKYLCSNCVEKLEKAITFKDQTMKNIAMLQSIKDEEYLDESILEEEEANTSDSSKPQKVVIIRKSGNDSNEEDIDEEDEDHTIQALDETTCIYCDLQLATCDEVHVHIRMVHGLEPRTGRRLQECPLCGVALTDVNDHLNRCHGVKSEAEGREYPCHFCENVYSSRKACFTHLRMKHGREFSQLKLYNDQTPKCVQRERKKCHMCSRDFSQKQILNKHLWKAHGIEVEKRKAFICPLCNERVSYGNHFSAHLLQRHRVHEQVEQLEFNTMDEFLLFKNAIQEETKYRFRKISASRQVIDGIRSNYMCSQSGVYVYQGKGKRPAPERQIYKTGKACPAHMIVTETLERVLVTFYKTHVGHGLCPYYEPREPKKAKMETITNSMVIDDVLKSENEAKDDDDKVENSLAWICDTCGMGFLDVEQFKQHITSHGPKLFPCQYCDNVFENIDSWTHHIQEHSDGSLF